MALTESQELQCAPGRPGLVERVRAWLSDASHTSLAQKVAGAAFLIRVANAFFAYVSQVLLARWMGSHEFGIYVYVWTWVLLVGGLLDLGLAQGAQKFIPEYAETKQPNLLRGFLAGSRWLALGLSTACAAVAILGVWLAGPWLEQPLVIPLILACLCLPIYAVASVQDGIGRAYSWVQVAMVPPYILRPLLLLGLMAAAHAAGLPINAQSAMMAAVGATWITSIVQLLMLNRRLRTTVPAGPRSFAFRPWLATSVPIFLVEGFYLLLTYTDILVLQQFRPPEDVAIYYAAAKTLALVAFVNFSVSAAVAHRFAEYHVNGDTERLSRFLADSIRWTFWPSLAAIAMVIALGLPFLWLFGPEFMSGYPVMFVLAVGLLARAAVGPVERLLNMVGQQNLCASVYGFAFALNLLGCLVLAPRFGAMGVAASTAFALVVESVLLFVVTKRRLGLHVFIWQGRARAAR